MNIFVTSLSLILIGIAMIHPIFFLPIDNQVRRGDIPLQFLRTNYIIHIIVGALSIVLYWIYSVNYPLQLAGVIYLTVIVVVVLFYWNAELTKWNLFTASIIFGFIVFYRSINEIVEITPLWPGVFTGFLGSGTLSVLILLLSESFHRPEQKTDNPLRYRLVKYLFILIGIRSAWQIIILFNLSVATQYGDILSALQFFWQSDSVKLFLLIFLGMILPLIYLLFLRKIMTNNSSKFRWILLLILFTAVFTAEFLNKYFLLQFGIVL